MFQYRKPVRVNVLQTIQYTFKDQNKNIINLTGFASCSLEIKLQGQLFDTIDASIITAGSGLVDTTYTFPDIGVWNLQFYCVDGGANKLFGEPIQITVVANVEDLTLNQLASY